MAEQERRLTIEFIGNFAQIEQKLDSIEARAQKGITVSGSGSGSSSLAPDRYIPQGGIINDSPTASGRGRSGIDRERDYNLRQDASGFDRAGKAADRGYDQYIRESARAAEREAKANERAANAAERRARKLEDLSEGRADSIASRNLNRQNANEDRFNRNNDSAKFSQFKRDQADFISRYHQRERETEEADFHGIQNEANYGANSEYGGGFSGGSSSSASAKAKQSSFSVGRTIKDTASLILRRLAIGAIVGGVLEVGNQLTQSTENALDSEFSSSSDAEARTLSAARSRRNSFIGYADAGVSYWGSKIAYIGDLGRSLGFDQAGKTEALEQVGQVQRWHDRGIADRTQSQLETLQIRGVEATGDTYQQSVLAADARLAEAKAANAAKYKTDLGDSDPNTVRYRKEADARADRGHTAELSVADRVLRSATNTLYSESQAARLSGNLDPIAELDLLRNKNAIAESNEKNPSVLEALKVRNRDVEATTYKGLIRDFNTQSIEDSAAIGANRQALLGNTFESERIRIQGQLAAKLNTIGTGSADPTLNTEIQNKRANAQGVADTEISLAKKADDNQRYATSQGIYNQAQTSYLQANNQGISAQAYSIKSDAELKADLITKQGGADAATNRSNTLKTGLNQEFDLKRQLELQTYYGARSAQDYGAGGIGGGNQNGDRFSQPIVQGLKDVQKAIEELSALIGRE